MNTPLSPPTSPIAGLDASLRAWASGALASSTNSETEATPQVLGGARDMAEWKRLALWIGGCGALYGAAMSSFGVANGAGLDLSRWPLLLGGALKLPILMGVSGVLSLPPFWVAYALWGLQDDFALLLRSLVRTQAVFALVLASLCPVILLAYASIGDRQSGYGQAMTINIFVFLAAGWCAQKVLRGACRRFEGEPRHRLLLRSWIWFYGFVGLQLAWMLRPFIGHPQEPVELFRHGALSNVYVSIWNALF
jgi:hypothetical protein